MKNDQALAATEAATAIFRVSPWTYIAVAWSISIEVLSLGCNKMDIYNHVKSRFEYANG